MTKGLTLENICIQHGARKLVEINAHVAPGEVLTVMGPSGSGKSTLLSMITGTLAREFSGMGRVLLDGVDITGLPTDRRRVGILFQDDLLFPHLSVGDNLAFGLSADVAPRSARQDAVDQALKEIGLEGFGGRDPATLSGGQKVRVSLMRVLLSAPCALLLDEPFSRLDADRRVQIRKLVFERAAMRGLPVVMVTHDASDADAAGGLIIQVG